MPGYGLSGRDLKFRDAETRPVGVTRSPFYLIEMACILQRKHHFLLHFPACRVCWSTFPSMHPTPSTPFILRDWSRPILFFPFRRYKRKADCTPGGSLQMHRTMMGLAIALMFVLSAGVVIARQAKITAP